jgi:hypothetical protein
VYKELSMKSIELIDSGKLLKDLAVEHGCVLCFQLKHSSHTTEMGWRERMTILAHSCAKQHKNVDSALRQLPVIAPACVPEYVQMRFALKPNQPRISVFKRPLSPFLYFSFPLINE